MKKPDLLQTKFASAADETEHRLNCICWKFAVAHYSSTSAAHKEAGLAPITLEALADGIKQALLRGDLFIEPVPDGSGYQLSADVMAPAQGSA